MGESLYCYGVTRRIRAVSQPEKYLVVVAEYVLIKGCELFLRKCCGPIQSFCLQNPRVLESNAGFREPLLQ